MKLSDLDAVQSLLSKRAFIEGAMRRLSENEMTGITIDLGADDLSIEVPTKRLKAMLEDASAAVDKDIEALGVDVDS